MEGYKIDFETPEGQQVPHWDEASNIHYDPETSQLELNGIETVQAALDKLTDMVGDIDTPTISVNSEGYWVIGTTNTQTSAKGTFEWILSTRNSTPSNTSSGWSTTQQLPTSTNKYLWFRVKYIVNGSASYVGPYLLMEYKTGGSSTGGGVNIEICSTDEPETYNENTLYFFT